MVDALCVTLNAKIVKEQQTIAHYVEMESHFKSLMDLEGVGLYKIAHILIVLNVQMTHYIVKDAFQDILTFSSNVYLASFLVKHVILISLNNGIEYPHFGMHL